MKEKLKLKLTGNLKSKMFCEPNAKRVLIRTEHEFKSCQ